VINCAHTEQSLRQAVKCTHKPDLCVGPLVGAQSREAIRTRRIWRRPLLAQAQTSPGEQTPNLGGPLFERLSSEPLNID
jgi:hypothetical protein